MNQSINLNLIPDGVKPVAKVSQFDVGRIVTFSLYQGPNVYTPPAGTTLEFRELKSDKHICVYDNAATLSGSTITLETTQQMTAAAGEALCQFQLQRNGTVLATLNFWLDVQTDPASEGDISDSDIPGIIALATEQMERAEAAADSAAADAESAADSKEDAETAATSAGTSATAAEDSAEDAEAYAIGTRGGTAVPSTDPAYHNNSKYYSDLAAVWGAHTPYIGANGNWYIFDIETGQYVDSGVDASITVQVADITMLPTNATPYVTNTGSSTDPIFHLFIPIGVGIASIEKTGTSGLVDTYTITYTDQTTDTFTVTNGEDGRGIVNIAKTATSGLVDTYTITYTDQTTSTFNVTNGEDGLNGADGEDGRGIVNITKTATAGLVDTYTITYTDGTTSTFNVTNGQDGSGSVQTVNNIQPIQGNVTLNLPDIADVNTTNLTSGQILVYNSTSQEWENADQNNGGHVIENPTGQNMPERTGLQFTGGVTVSDDPTNGRTVVNVSGGHTIVDENGVSYPQRANLKITNATITDDSANNTTLVDITGGGGTTIVQKPTVTVGTYTYNGTAQGPTITGLDTDHCTVTNATKTDAGTYTLTISLKNTSTMVWSDITTADITAEYTIAKKSVTIPTVSGSFTYDGTEKTATIGSTGDSAYWTQGGTASATNAGTYTVTFDLDDLVNTKWSDDTTAQKSGTWTIAKAEQTIQLSKNSVTLDVSALYDTVTVALTAGDGTLSAVSSDTSIATATLSNGSIRMDAVNNGTTTVVVTASETANYGAKTATISVTVALATDLDDASWATISAAAQDGTASSMWDVGDCKGITVNGTVGTLSINQTLYVFILGFNHNSSVEGIGIQFGCFKTAKENGIDVALCDSTYGSYKSDGTKTFNMNHWGGSSNPYNTNYGGWKGCDARYDILGSTKQAPSGYGSTPTTSRAGYDAASDTATSPMANTLMAALPSTLRSVMKPITKYTDNTGNSSTAAANVTPSVDYLPLLAEYEIFGSNSYANTNEASKQVQYKYFENGNSKIKYNHSSTASAVAWWSRSPRSSTAGAFCFTGGSGTATNYASRTSYGFAPAFRV